MNSATIATILAALALGLSGVLYLKVDQLQDEVRSARAPARIEERTVAPLDSSVAFAPEPGALVGAPGAMGGGAPATREGAPPVRVPGDRERSLEERLAHVQRELAEMKAERGVFRHPSRTFARSVDDLSRHLSLSSTQRTRIEDAVDRAKRRIEDVLKIPDETGKSPYERRQEAQKKIEEALKDPKPGSVLAVTADLFSYREQKIPGRADTYGDEIDRIKKETREEIAAALDPKQREAFQETSIDPMLGGGGGQVAFFSSMSGPEGEETQGEIVVEMGTTITDEASPPPEAGAEPPGTGD